MATINGTPNNDNLPGTAEDDVINGFAGDDTLQGLAGNDQLYGGDGNDMFRGGSGTDYYDGGPDNPSVSSFGQRSYGDRVTFYDPAATAGAIADLRTGIIENDGYGNRELMVGIEGLGGGTAFVDKFYGNDAANLLIGDAGDTLMGFGGDDVFQSASAPALTDGGAGRDELVLVSNGSLIPDNNGDGLAEVRATMTRGWVIDLALQTIVDGYGGTGTIAGIEKVTGTELNDEIRGSDADDELVGAFGNDILLGRGGNDLINARSGSDTADGGDGIDTLTYSRSDFSFAAYDYNVSSNNGPVFVDLQQGIAEEGVVSKIVIETPGMIEVRAASGTINSDTPRLARDIVTGFENIVGTGLGDALYGNDLDNVITPGAGDDIVDGRGGIDTVDYSSARGAMTVNLATESSVQAASGASPQVYFSFPPGATSQTRNDIYADDDRISTDQLFKIENVTGSNLNDSITGDVNANTLRGLDGNDVILGGAGDDVIEGGAGDDELRGEDGDDTLRGGLGNDKLYGGAGNDFLSEASGDNGPFGNDLYDGGEGNDRVSLFTSFGPGVTVDLRLTTAQNTGSMGIDTFIGIEHITSNYGNDTLIGNEADNWFWTFSGTDTLSGNGGNDYFTVGLGDKIADGGSGNDTIEVYDLAFQPAYTSAGITVSLALQGTAQATGIGNWTLTNIENLGGSFGADRLTGDGNANILAGAQGDDTLRGGGGNDILAGDGTFNLDDNAAPGFLIDPDWVGGNDILEGGAGDDTIHGGGGIDTAVYQISRAQASVVLNANGTVTVKAGAEGIDTLTSIERIQFSDGLYSFQFAGPSGVLVSNFAVGAGGWSSQNSYPRHIADVNGDGYTDIVGFGQSGVLVSFGSANGSFSGAGQVLANFGQAQGWSSDNQFHRELADVNGDGRADIVGFGTAGTLVSFGRADGSFSDPITGIANFGANQGWSTQDGFARVTGDVNGDGRADIIGFGVAGTFVSLGNGDGTFSAARLTLGDFGNQQGWTSDNQFHRTVADVNADGFDDIIGFGTAGTLVALSKGDGTFSATTLALNNFGKGQGWSTQDSFARQVADVNGDGNADIVGFGLAGTYVAYGLDNGSFTQASLDVANFGANQGWTSDNIYHRELADIDNDGAIDIVGFGQTGVLVGYNLDYGSLI
ncbi:calcium-binding protein [Sphingomonas glaciei]|uniref:FG-GAP-like repeat-containing protein n=1 Tax=Sphingomonas glaciei TaxID=2938948 RepID=A0ABY5MTA6_9SPHN|nr:FG-GAP-like repeat-containing protein [Sphingomonas glaciei]UUR07176.1 FG-GAP-like repeat-containing protein [Sphingomonas glaciei]